MRPGRHSVLYTQKRRCERCTPLRERETERERGERGERERREREKREKERKKEKRKKEKEKKNSLNTDIFYVIFTQVRIEGLRDTFSLTRKDEGQTTLSV